MKTVSAASSVADFQQNDNGDSFAPCKEKGTKNTVFDQTPVRTETKDSHKNQESPDQHHDYWQEIAPDRRQNLVRVTHRNHEGPLRRLSIWDGVVNALGRHYNLLSSGSIAVGETTGRHHPGDTNTAPYSSLPASIATEQNQDNFRTQPVSKSLQTPEIRLFDSMQSSSNEDSPTNPGTVITIDDDEEEQDYISNQVPGNHGNFHRHQFTSGGMNQKFTEEANVVSKHRPLIFSEQESQVANDEIEASAAAAAAGCISHQDNNAKPVMTMSDSCDALIMYSDEYNDASFYA